MSEEAVNLSKLKVQELKQLLKDQGLSVSGNKAELIERLKLSTQDGSGEEDLLLNDGEGEDDVEDEEDLAETEEILEDLDEPETTESKAEEEEDAAPAIQPVTSATKPVLKDENLQKRVEKFGLVSEDARKASRAARFGLPDSSSPAADATGSKSAAPNSEKLKQRAERFGGSVASENKEEGVSKLKKRAERFGSVTSTELTKVEGENALKKRAERFGAVTSPELAKTESEDKLTKRKQKFGVEITGPDGAKPATSDEAEAKRLKRAERFGLAA